MAAEVIYNPTQYARSAEPLDKTAILPGSATAYRASGTVESEVPCLALIMGRDGFKPGGDAYILLPYVHIGNLRFGFTDSGQGFRFTVADLEPLLVTVHGTGLLRIAHNIGLKRLPWIRQADRGFRPPGEEADEPLITRIDVDDWKPKPRKAGVLAEAMAEELV